jgi:NAD(P)-dependent dehydrogenase (short-subunit alcohol dehydrogenase family)
MPEKSPVAIVTGASRGAGQGIARALGSHGCTVYVTGRTLNLGDHNLGGTIGETAQLVTDAGGKGIAVKCDHSKPDEVKAFFDRVMADEGRIDILVNNAAAVYDELSMPGGFWERPLKLGDMIDVGIRSSFDASWYAAQAMVKQNDGLIIFTSGAGAEHYVFSPAYGAHKTGMDKMAFDMAMEFDHAGKNVAAVSIWMGAVMTERLRMVIDSDPVKFGALEAGSETPDFTGHLTWALYNDPKRKARNGNTYIGAELAREYGLTDVGGRQPPSYRDTHGVTPHGFSKNAPVRAG